MAATTVHVSIAIFEGNPLDYQKYRHTSLFIKFGNDEPSVVVHVVGFRGEFEFDTKDNYDPVRSESFAKAVEVGFLSVQANRARIIEILRAVPIGNHDPEFNCQTWVEAALKSLKELCMLTDAAYTKGVDGMVAAIAEAKNESD